MEIERVGMIGAGQMGNGIAQVFAQAGFDVALHDVSAAALEAAPGIIAGHLDRQVSKGRLSAEERDAALKRIRIETDLAALGPSDLVIEAATEKEALKHQIFKALVPHLAPQTILTSNTSSISITRLASGTDRPERFMGFHFMNPVPVMQLVELIRGIATDEPTVKAVRVSRVIAKAVEARRPSARYVTPWWAGVGISILRHLPVRLADALLARTVGLTRGQLNAPRSSAALPPVDAA